MLESSFWSWTRVPHHDTLSQEIWLWEVCIIMHSKRKHLHGGFEAFFSMPAHSLIIDFEGGFLISKVWEFFIVTASWYQQSFIPPFGSLFELLFSRLTAVGPSNPTTLSLSLSHISPLRKSKQKKMSCCHWCWYSYQFCGIHNRLTVCDFPRHDLFVWTRNPLTWDF